MSWALFVVGGFVCVLNFYLSFLRYPIHRMRGGDPDEFRWSSGFPAIGSILVALVWGTVFRHEGSAALDALTLVLVLVDTGGLHWFAGVMVWQAFAGRGESEE